MSRIPSGDWKTTKPRPANGVRFTCSRCGSQAEVWLDGRSTAVGEPTPDWIHRSDHPPHDPPPDGWIFEGYARRPQRWWCPLCAPPVREYRAAVQAWEQNYHGVASGWPWKFLPVMAREAKAAWLRRNPMPRHPYQELCR